MIHICSQKHSSNHHIKWLELFGGDGGIRTHVALITPKRFRVGVVIQTLKENAGKSQTTWELENPWKISIFQPSEVKKPEKPDGTRSSKEIRFWGEKSPLGRRWGELGEKTQLNADDTYLYRTSKTRWLSAWLKAWNITKLSVESTPKRSQRISFIG